MKIMLTIYDNNRAQATQGELVENKGKEEEEEEQEETE